MITPRRRIRETFLPWVQLAVDCLVISALLRAVFWLRFPSNFFESNLGVADYPFYHRSFNLIVLIIVLFLRLYGLYKTSRLLTFAGEAGKVLKAVGAGFLVLMAATFFVREFTYSRTYLVMVSISLAIGISLARFVLGILVMWLDEQRKSFRQILVIGCDENAKKMVQFYKNNRRFSTRVMGFLDDKLSRETMIEGVPVLGKTEELGDYIRIHKEIHEVVLAAQGLSNEAVLKTIYECEKQMVTFRWITDIFGLITSRMSVSYLSGVPLLSFSDSPLGDWENRVLKRTTDIVLSAAALLFLSPIFILLAVLIKLDSKGPIFFGQQRIGEDGRRFVLLKLRTMRVGAEKQTGPVWAKENDPRRTKLGAFLRRNNLDELPQLWNVFNGDMSLVGPRPERPFFVSQFKEDIPRYMARHSIKSGITGWAQVNGLRGDTSIEERTKFDLYYIENWSLLFDFKILFMTIFARHNAY